MEQKEGKDMTSQSGITPSVQNEVKIYSSKLKVSIFAITCFAFAAMFGYLLSNNNDSSIDYYLILLLLVFAFPGGVLMRNKRQLGLSYFLGLLFLSLIGLYLWLGIMGLFMVGLVFFLLGGIALTYVLLFRSNKPDIWLYPQGFTVYTGLITGTVSGTWDEVEKITLSSMVMAGKTQEYFLSVVPNSASDILARYPQLNSKLSKANSSLLGTAINVGLGRLNMPINEIRSTVINFAQANNVLIEDLID